MKNIFPILFLILLTSCLKTDVLNQPEDINFLKTDFYQQRFDDFYFEIKEVSYSDPELNNGNYTFLTAVTYQLPEDYMNELFGNWPHKVELEFDHTTKKLTQGQYLFTDTIGRRKEGTVVNFEGTLKVLKIFKVMAHNTHSESFVVGN